MCHSVDILVDSKGKGVLTPHTAMLSSQVPELQWSAPPEGWIKVNCDGSFTARSKTAGAGAVARDHLGAVLFAACAPVENCDDAEEAEARAALMRVELITQLAPALLQSPHCVQFTKTDQPVGPSTKRPKTGLLPCRSA
jgi:hypothetical protein